MIERRPTHFNAALLLALGALLAGSASGCGSGHGEEGCPEYCEQLLACPAVDTSEAQCLSACEANQTTAESKGCSQEYTDLLECFGHAEDVCDAEALDDECTIQDQAYDACVGAG